MQLFGLTVNFNLIQTMYTLQKIYQINILNYEYVDSGELFTICYSYAVLISIFGLVSFPNLINYFSKTLNYAI